MKTPTSLPDEDQEECNGPLVVHWGDVKQEEDEGAVDKEENPEVHVANSEVQPAPLERGFLPPGCRETDIKGNINNKNML